MRDSFQMKSYKEIEPKLARTIDNENAPNKFAGYNPQPDVMGNKKFYALKKARKSSASRLTSLSNTGINEQNYSPMTRFKHD